MTDPGTGGDRAQVVENVLTDAGVSGHTRRRLIQKAAIGAAGAGALSQLGIGSALAAGDSPTTVGTVAVTAEALAVTYLHRVLEVNEGAHAFNSTVVDILRAAGSAELDHYNFLKSAGFTPLTTRFWLPNDFFGTKLGNVAATIEVAETLFVNAYLIGITVFAQAGNPTVARYAGEVCGVESEHRTLARFLQGKLPDNLGFEGYTYTSVNQIVAALEGAGVGFGKRGSKPGEFYQFTGMGDEFVKLENPTPR
jgi:hypothetical protein